MEKKIQRAINNLQKSTKANPVSKFSHEDLQSGNSFKANVFFNSKNLPEIVVSQNNGYQIKELASNLELSLRIVLHSPLPDAKPGNKIYTRRAAHVGDIVLLNSESYYYRIDGSIFDCTGKMLGRQFQAKCIATNYSAKCSPTSAIANYTIFNLL